MNSSPDLYSLHQTIPYGDSPSTIQIIDQDLAGQGLPYFIMLYVLRHLP
ncbi:hypothetical protein CJA_2233 [Cellvibrio japonicus Ueda107]|uniref:Uncharacterized protein n=1 Tax=Cellvibrio japonicus (strain Ueda107) TaxID=498211 RepID=B3PJC0_CELJU|nr:hypothetical protein [Cellvibrio japonicus]ACE83263.1 hypothetical protein CJA_2233 [Cellvibrio japonicus Ueda107]